MMSVVHVQNRFRVHKPEYSGPRGACQCVKNAKTGRAVLNRKDRFSAAV
jgi:hypothetical protein